MHNEPTMAPRTRRQRRHWQRTRRIYRALMWFTLIIGMVVYLVGSKADAAMLVLLALFYQREAR